MADEQDPKVTVLADTQEAPAGQPDAAQDQRAMLRLRYDNAETNYANFFIVNNRPEEVILNMGVNVMPPQQRPGEQPELNVEITNRLILSYTSAKRLAITLGNVIQAFENVNGVIDINPRAPAGGPAPGQPAPAPGQPAPAPGQPAPAPAEAPAEAPEPEEEESE